MKTYQTALWLAEKTVIGVFLAAMLTTWGILILGSHAYRLGSQCRRTVNTVNTLYAAMSRTISARIPDDLYEQLQATAKALGVTVSQLISQAIAAHVNTVNMADPAENLSLGEMGSHNLPESAVNSPELVARLEMVESRLTALEQRVAGIPSLSEQPPVDRDPIRGSGTESSLAGLTVKELRKLASERGIPHYWLMNKADLIAALV
jgi:predicted DNA-binding protein